MLKVFDFYRYHSCFHIPLCWSDRFFQDARGMFWRVIPYNRATYERYFMAEPGGFSELKDAVDYIAYVKRAHFSQDRERKQRRYPLCSFKVFRVVRADGSARFELTHKAELPHKESDRDELRPLSTNGLTFEDVTAEARAELYRQQVEAGLLPKFRKAEDFDGLLPWQKDGIVRCIQPSVNTRVHKFAYFEQAGRWTATDCPESIWNRRDTVEVFIRANRPDIRVAIYKKAGDPAKNQPMLFTSNHWRTPLQNKRVMDRLLADSLNKIGLSAGRLF